MNRIVIGVVLRSARMSSPPPIVNAFDERDAARIAADRLRGLDIELSTHGAPIEPAGMEPDDWFAEFWDMAALSGVRLRMTLEVMD